MNTVGILGGMGPAVGADFVRLFVNACTDHLRRHGQTVNDQSFPEHWLAQVPVPDRMRALQDQRSGGHQPLDPMLQALGRLAALGAKTVAIACNTAHAWHTHLQSSFPQLSLLHIADETAKALAKQGEQRVILLATEGTYQTGLYDAALRQYGITCVVPSGSQRARITRGIFEGVKAGNLALASALFSEVAQELTQEHGAHPIIMGCTEIPLALLGSPVSRELELVDPAQVLAASLAEHAYRN
jgi:aspartate racemase